MRQKFRIRDEETDEIVSTVTVTDEDELIEKEEMAEALGFYLEEVDND